MKIKRVFLKQNEKASEKIEFEKRSSVIRNPDGSLVFEMNNVLIPKHWSQVATDIIAQKYFRKGRSSEIFKKGQRRRSSLLASAQKFEID